MKALKQKPYRMDSQKAIQMDFLTNFYTSLPFSFLENHQRDFYKPLIRSKGLRKLLYCVLENGVCHY